MRTSVIDIAQLASPTTQLTLRDTAAGYPFIEERKVLRVNSSGRCNLNCPYCFTNGGKKNSAMTNDDADFLFERLGENIFFIFTGVGDFFAGYHKEQRFLENILKHKSEVFLDANGVSLNEFQELTDEQIKKILFFDVSYHYSTMKKSGHLHTWAQNAQIVAHRMEANRYIFKTIFAFPEIQIWKEILDFYTQYVFHKTLKPLDITLDEFDSRMQSEQVIAFINQLIKNYPDSVCQKRFHRTAGNYSTHYEMATSLGHNKNSQCPSGSLYFKIDVDGNIMPCDKVGGYLANQRLVLGNTKNRQLYFIQNIFNCPRVQGPCCIKSQDESYPSRR